MNVDVQRIRDEDDGGVVGVGRDTCHHLANDGCVHLRELIAGVVSTAVILRQDGRPGRHDDGVGILAGAVVGGGDVGHGREYAGGLVIVQSLTVTHVLVGVDDGDAREESQRSSIGDDVGTDMADSYDDEVWGERHVDPFVDCRPS